MDRDEIFLTVRDVVAESLFVKPEDIKRESRLIEELSADSLDFLDMVFALEKKFGISVRDGELELLTRLDFAAPGVLSNGFLTEETVKRLAVALPAILEKPDQDRITPGQLLGMITVETLCLMVEKRVGQDPTIVNS
jgi:acyl carrier protein